jgi:Ca2+-binding RTX toxin-like protein
MHGGAGDDLLSDGAGADLIDAGDDDDHVVAAADSAADSYMGDEGYDTLDYSLARQHIAVDLGRGTAEGADIGTDSVAGFEKLIGGAGDDELSAGAESASINGGAGDDLLSDGAGADSIEGGEGNDHVQAAMDAADDCYSGGSGRDALDYSRAMLSITVNLGEGTAEGLEIGKDLLAEFEQIIGGHGDDHLIAGSRPVEFKGGDGDDTFEFSRPDADHQPDLVRKITDFTVGDRILAATYEIYYRDEDDAADEVADLFDDVYLADDGDKRPVRFRFEKQDDNDVTMVDVHDRPDDDQNFYSIQLSGHHHLQFTVAVS